MYLKISGENIVGHDFTSHDNYNIEIKDTILIDHETGLYKYKYVDGELVELSENEKKNHPLKLKEKRRKKIERLLKKQVRKSKANKYREVKKDISLSAEDISEIDDMISELEA